MNYTTKCCFHKINYCTECFKELKESILSNFFNKDTFTLEKAYLLGWISTVNILNNSVELKSTDSDVINAMNKMFFKDGMFKLYASNEYTVLKIYSDGFAKHLYSIFGGINEFNTTARNIPSVITSGNADIIKAYFRGVFDNIGNFQGIDISIKSIFKNILVQMKELIETKLYLKTCTVVNSGVFFQLQFRSPSDSFNFIASLNSLVDLPMTDTNKAYYRFLCNYTPTTELTLRYKKLTKEAVVPSKAFYSDSGYDLTLIREIKRDGITTFYGTGIAIQVPYGYYTEIHPRSSISKTGYILANNTGIIDNSYTGELIVALKKVENSKPDIVLPCKLVQLIPKKFIHLDTQEVTEFTETSRNSGGFGSTD